MHAVIACLYGHLEVMANVLKNMQLVKRTKLTNSLALEKVRNSILGEGELSPRLAAAQAPEAVAFLPEENKQLLQEMQETDSEQIIAIQKSVGDINAMLSSFGVKVVEHQEISDRSKS